MHAQLRINHRLNDIDSWLSAPLVVEASPHRIFAPGMPIRPNGSYRPRLDCGRVGAGSGRDRAVQTAISRIWRAFGLQPHLVDTWKLSTDPLFIDKVRNVVGLHLDPPDTAMVLCVDEELQMQALDRTAPMLS